MFSYHDWPGFFSERSGRLLFVYRVGMELHHRAQLEEAFRFTDLGYEMRREVQVEIARGMLEGVSTAAGRAAGEVARELVRAIERGRHSPHEREFYKERLPSGVEVVVYVNGLESLVREAIRSIEEGGE